MTPLGTLLVCLIAAAGVGLLRFAAQAPPERVRRVARTPARAPVRELPRPRVEPALGRTGLPGILGPQPALVSPEGPSSR